METSASAGTPAERRSSAPLTAVIGLGVLVVGVVFAFDSAWYTHWYALLRVGHVAASVFWVGGGLLLTVLGLRAERSDDPNELAMLARQAAWAGERLFAPAGLLVLLLGIGMMINTNWGWGKFWIVAGLVGYATTFVTGLTVLSPLAKKIDELLRTEGPAAPATNAAIKRILLIARFDIAVLLLVVADMVTKPFSN